MTPTPELDEALRILRKADAADMAACLVPREVRAVLDALRRTPQAAPVGAYEHPEHGLTCSIGGCSLRVESGDEGTAFYVPTPPSYAPQAATEQPYIAEGLIRAVEEEVRDRYLCAMPASEARLVRAADHLTKAIRDAYRHPAPIPAPPIHEPPGDEK